MLPITNDDELNTAMSLQMQEVIDKVTDILLKKLIDIIQQTVYDPFVPLRYERQGSEGGLISEWEKSIAKINGTSIESTIKENPSLLKEDSSRYIHGDPMHGDLRTELAHIINEYSIPSIFEHIPGDFWWKHPRPFFNIFIELLDNGEFENVFEEILNAEGIQYIKS